MIKRTIYLPADIDAELEAEAAATGRTVAGMVRWIVEGFLRDTRERDQEGEQ